MKKETKRLIEIILRGIGWIAGILIVILLIYGILKNLNLV